MVYAALAERLHDPLRHPTEGGQGFTHAMLRLKSRRRAVGEKEPGRLETGQQIANAVPGAFPPGAEGTLFPAGLVYQYFRGF